MLSPVCVTGLQIVDVETHVQPHPRLKLPVRKSPRNLVSATPLRIATPIAADSRDASPLRVGNLLFSS